MLNRPQDYQFWFSGLIRCVGNARTIVNYIVNTSLGISLSLLTQEGGRSTTEWREDHSWDLPKRISAVCVCWANEMSSSNGQNYQNGNFYYLYVEIIHKYITNHVHTLGWLPPPTGLEYLGWCGWNLMKSQSTIQMMIRLGFDWSSLRIVSVHLYSDSKSQYCGILKPVLSITTSGISDVRPGEMCVYNYKCLRCLIAQIYCFPY